MGKGHVLILSLLLALAMTLGGCQSPSGSSASGSDSSARIPNEATSDSANSGQKQATVENIDLAAVKPNEDGKIMVLMFHNFVEEFKPTKYDDGQYTTTFSEFSKLLDELYSKDYRLISLNDYMSNQIGVPAGKKPIVFTFDDGTAGQFNLVEQDGQLGANPRTAVGILEAFNQKHPDFGLKATFFVNLADNTFVGKGTLADRLNYLIGKGFDIGNHTYSHINLSTVKSEDKVLQEVGGNQKKMLELVPGYQMKALALPLGARSKSFEQTVIKGVYEGVSYENLGIMEVGAEPARSPASKKYTGASIRRVRATGMKQVDGDLKWWLEQLSRETEYVSDGNPNTVTVPKANEADIDQGRLGGKKLIVY